MESDILLYKSDESAELFRIVAGEPLGNDGSLCGGEGCEAGKERPKDLFVSLRIYKLRVFEEDDELSEVFRFVDCVCYVFEL